MSFLQIRKATRGLGCGSTSPLPHHDNLDSQVLLDTTNTILGLSLVSVGGLASSIVESCQVLKVAILANAARRDSRAQRPLLRGVGAINLGFVCIITRAKTE